jgi:hypothetical protein
MASKQELAAAERAEKIEAIRRKGRLKAWSDYLGFWVSKAAGMTGVAVGGLEIFDPAVIPAVIANPEVVLGAGLALLTSRALLTMAVTAGKLFE